MEEGGLPGGCVTALAALLPGRPNRLGLAVAPRLALACQPARAASQPAPGEGPPGVN